MKFREITHSGNLCNMTVATENPLLLWYREGLGDHFVAAGLVHHKSQIHSHVYVICSNPRSLNSIKWLFSRLRNVSVIESQSPTLSRMRDLAQELGAELQTAMQDYVFTTSSPWFVACYEQHGLDYQQRYQGWPAPLHGPRSWEVFQHLRPKPGAYRVVHNHCGEAGGDLELTLPAAHGMPTIYVTPGVSLNLFDWSLVLTHASEIHVLDSSVYHLVASMDPYLRGQVTFHHIKAFNQIRPSAHILPYHPNWKIQLYESQRWQPNTYHERVKFDPSMA